MRFVSAAVVACFVAVSAFAQASSDMFVTKTAPASTTVGSNITFTVTVGNNGPDPAPNGRFHDVLPADVTFVSINQTAGPAFTCTTPTVGMTGNVDCTVTSSPLATGTFAQFDIVVNVSAPAAGTTLINTATAASDNPDNNSENNTAISGTSVAGGNLADVGVVKTGPQSAPSNSDVTYTITVHNGGPNDATNVSLTDTLPAGVPAGHPMTFVSFMQNSGPTFSCSSGTTTTCSIATFPNGSTATFTLVGHIPSGTPGGTQYTNNATLTSDNDPNPDNDTSATTVTVSSVDVGVTKSAPPTAVAGGPTFNYVIVVSNGGPDAASDVTFNDNLPAGINFVSLSQNTGPAALGCSTPAPNTNGSVACTITLLNNGASAQFTITVQAAPTVANGTVVNNTATVTTSSADTNPNNNSSTAATTVSANADLAIAKSGPASGTAGNNITYTITVTNNGPSTASSVSWTDTLPAGETFVSENQTTGPTFNCTTGATITCSIPSLAPGVSATFSVVVNISPATPNGSQLSNTANVTSTTPDNTPGNNSSTATTSVSASADLSVMKSGPAATASNTNVVYTVTAANAGPSAAANVTLTETVPAGMTFVSVNQTTGPAFLCSGTGPVVCTIASFNAGASATFQFTFNVPLSTPSGTQTTNTVTISSPTPDNNPANNSASVTTTVGASIPALSPLAMALLAMALAALGWMVMKR